MTTLNAHVKTYSAGNLFQFKCPIFGATAKINDCLRLFELWKKGSSPPVRKGCQACMMSSKCPMYHVEQEVWHHDADDYYSPTPKIGSLSERILHRIAKIWTLDSAIQKYQPMDEAQSSAIHAANMRARGAADTEFVPTKAKTRRKLVAVEDTTPETSILADAAASGDMSAAINQAVGAGA